MKLLLVAALLFGCGAKGHGPDRWSDVEKLAVPTVAAADGTILRTAIDRVVGDDVPEVALEEAMAWRKAGGGLPWRDGRAVDDSSVIRAYKIGDALLERRGDDPEAIASALYLAQRLRAEAPALIDVSVGFTLAAKATKKVARPDYAAYAPTEAEIRRAIPADAVHTVRMVRETSKGEDQTIENAVKRAFADMLVDAPADRAGYVKRIDEHTKRAAKSEVLAMLFAPRLPALAQQMYEALDGYRAWMK